MKYPADEYLYVDEICNEQFLIGNHLLATPILYALARERKIYLPSHKWYDLHTGKVY
jgi:alpha-glucosidase (family GH31 glycosyl hydrolase)